VPSQAPAGQRSLPASQAPRAGPLTPLDSSGELAHRGFLCGAVQGAQAGRYSQVKQASKEGPAARRTGQQAMLLRLQLHTYTTRQDATKGWLARGTRRSKEVEND